MGGICIGRICPNCVRFAGELPDKSLEEIRWHYEVLVEDVRSIEDGRVEIPRYDGRVEILRYDGGFEGLNGGGVDGKEGGLGNGGGGGKEVGKVSMSEHEWRNGIAWTEEDHMLFLLGLEKFGKGDWRSISRHFVITRTPTQVASHAQKYFIRLNSVNKDRRRSSIHDITSMDARDISTSHDPITHQTDGTLGMGGGSGNHSNVFPPSIGQPVDGPFQSSLNMPQGAAIHHEPWPHGVSMTPCPHYLGDVGESSTDEKI